MKHADHLAGREAESGASLAGPRLKIVLGAALFSTGGTAIKAANFTGMEVAGLRSGIAVLAILLLIPAARNLGTRRTWLVSLAYAATMFTFVLANKFTTAANTTFLQATAPFYILLLGPLLLRERVRRGDAAYMAVVSLGLALFFIGTERPLATAPNPRLGNILSAISGVTWALTIVGLRWLGRSGGSGSAASAVAGGNFLSLLLSLPWLVSVGEKGMGDWILVGYLGFFQVGVAYYFVTAAMRRVPALEASLLLMTEPVLNPIWAFLVHGEVPGPWSICGGAVILLSTAGKTLRDFGRGKGLG